MNLNLRPGQRCFTTRSGMYFARGEVVTLVEDLEYEDGAWIVEVERPGLAGATFSELVEVLADELEAV